MAHSVVTGKIGFNHEVDTIKMSESTLTCQCLVCKTAPATPSLLKMEKEMFY